MGEAEHGRSGGGTAEETVTVRETHFVLLFVETIKNFVYGIS